MKSSFLLLPKNNLLFFLLFVFIGCSTKEEYDYSRIIKLPPDQHNIGFNYYEALSGEMFGGNTLGDTLLLVNSLHHKNVVFIGGMVFGDGIESGYPCVWAKTGGIEKGGMFYSLNTFSKFLPQNKNFSTLDCCVKAISKMTRVIYKNKK